MVVMKETVRERTILGILEMIYNYPVMWYIWDKRKGVYTYTDYDHLPGQFNVNRVSLDYGLKIISVKFEEA